MSRAVIATRPKKTSAEISTKYIFRGSEDRIALPWTKKMISTVAMVVRLRMTDRVEWNRCSGGTDVEFPERKT